MSKPSFSASFFLHATIAITVSLGVNSVSWAEPQQKVKAVTHENPATDAQLVAKTWLKDIDGDQWGQAWEHAAPLFQAQMSKEKWETSMIRIRGLLGGVEKRKLVAVNIQHSLPGVPDGDYVVLQFDTKFEHKARALETVTPVKDADGKWKVARYTIK